MIGLIFSGGVAHEDTAAALVAAGRILSFNESPSDCFRANLARLVVAQGRNTKHGGVYSPPFHQPSITLYSRPPRLRPCQVKTTLNRLNKPKNSFRERATSLSRKLSAGLLSICDLTLS